MHADESYTLFPTAIGRCGIAWSDRGLTRVQLPEASEAATAARLARRGGRHDATTMTHAVIECAALIGAYVGGARVDFAGVSLDTSSLAAFDIDVYRALQQVGWGHTTTYGTLAAAVGAPDAARAVGVAMARNPWPIVVPCHRVLAAHGAIGGFSAYGGTMTKQKLLALENNGIEMLPLFSTDA